MNHIFHNNERSAFFKSAGLYIHIPFCVKKCNYCDFLSFPADDQVRRAYMDCLEKELDHVLSLMKSKGEIICTVYIGGGTPSVLPAEWICRLVGRIKESGLMAAGGLDAADEGGAEITIEVNPGTVDDEKLRAYAMAGINRLSMGVQSFHDDELKLLGRIHSAADAIQTFDLARKAGFDNISLDLMSGLPDQTIEKYQASLEEAVRLAPKHISSYSLIIEEGTPFYQTYGPGWSEQEEHEEQDRLMYELTSHFLAGHGYHRYEISNYAMEGWESRHNSSYWTGTPYYGIGLGASSLIRGRAERNGDSGEKDRASAESLDLWRRTRNTADMKTYLAAGGQLSVNGVSSPGSFCPLEEDMVLSLQDRMEEFMFLGLRMTKGVSEADFEERFGSSLMQVYGMQVSELIEEGLMAREITGCPAASDTDYRLRLTERGLDLSNYCFARFLM
ncbi:MAG: radical SAM family heme chaperone HemW [Lachnospiraceae bacterium]|nr:radical SAM family heme chaperone HemW [Lachnospiraceae bacterium]